MLSMIRFIAAIDSKRGMANDKGIPWNLPTDKAYYRDRVKTGVVLMGMGTYNEMRVPLGDKIQLVATHEDVKLRPGFKVVADAREYLIEAQKRNEDVWVIGGPGLFATTLDLADELYLTLIDQDFNCTKFFPEYQNDFELAGQSDEKHDEQIENGIKFRFTTWRRKSK